MPYQSTHLLNSPVDGVTSHTTFMIQTAIITRMDIKRPIAASTGSNHTETGMFRFATGMFVEYTITGHDSKAKLPFETFKTFGNATARLRPRYRNGHSPADGDGHRASA